jgi:hypothetical protein
MAFMTLEIVSSPGIRLTKVVILTLLVVCFTHLLNAKSPSTVDKREPIAPTLIIDPSSSAVSLGRAYLSVDPLVHKGNAYVGGYQLRVVPYVFKSEKGMLELNASDDVIRMFLEEKAVPFSGKATNNKNGKPKSIAGKISPSTKSQGSVTFSVKTDNGTIVFNTTYHIGK